MDQQHPIPQDVTGFQFKLIGEMTVKQFAYLAGGVVIAWIFYALPIFWLIKYPFILLSAGLGVCLAFVPIEGRPFDVMLMNFLRAFISPTQFVYQKNGYTILPNVPPLPKKPVQTPAQKDSEQSKLSEEKLQKYLNAMPKAPKNSLDEKEMRFLGALPLHASQTSVAQSSSHPYASAAILSQAPVAQPQQEVAQTVMVAPQPVIQQAPAPTPQILEQPASAPQLPPAPGDETNEALEKEAQIIQQELTQAKQEEAVTENTPTKAVAHEKVVELEKELAEILSQKQTLQNQLITLKKELAMQKQQVFTPSMGAPVKAETKNVRIIPQGQGKSAGLPIAPEVANLLTGIVKDSRGNTLPNILVEVKDTDGNPVRAFKTNGLGQFAAATPLANGTYTVTFEDSGGKHKFDTIELPVAGMIIQPIEVISTDQREELRKELFK